MSRDWPIEKFAEEQQSYLATGMSPELVEPERVGELISERIEKIKIRIQLAKENRLMMPRTFYVNDVTFLLKQLGIELEPE